LREIIIKTKSALLGALTPVSAQQVEEHNYENITVAVLSDFLGGCEGPRLVC